MDLNSKNDGWLLWAIPYKYILTYIYSLVLVLFIFPVITGLKYTFLGYVVNYFLIDAIFYRWCIQKIEDDEAEERRKKFFNGR